MATVPSKLHTGDLPRACAFYAGLCGWRPERIDVGSCTYWALELGGGFGGGGIVECKSARPLWLPYVEVADIADITERARRLGASVLLEPRRALPVGVASSQSPPARRSRSGSPRSIHDERGSRVVCGLPLAT